MLVTNEIIAKMKNIVMIATVRPCWGDDAALTLLMVDSEFKLLSCIMVIFLLSLLVENDENPDNDENSDNDENDDNDDNPDNAEDS